MSVCIRSYAKVNLYLKVLGRAKQNGYHYINTLMSKIDLFDNILITEITKSSPDHITKFTGDFCSFVDQKNNIITKLLHLIDNKLNGRKFLIEVEKNIPVCSGLGGGSSNCAYVLEYLWRWYFYDISFNDVCSIASSLGSDVVFFLYNSIGICTGFGSNFLYVDSDLENQIRSYTPILIYPHSSIATKQSTQNAYLLFNLSSVDTEKTIQNLNLQGIDFTKVGNDFFPLLRQKYSVIEEFYNVLSAIDGVDYCSVTGSGLCMICLVKTSDSEDVYNKIKNVLGNRSLVYCTKFV